MHENRFLCSLFLLILSVSIPAAAQRNGKHSANVQSSIPSADASKDAAASLDSNPATEERIFTVVEKHAEFQGGAAAMQQFIQENLKMPKEVKKNNVAGKVYTKLLVEKDGHITDVQIITGLTAMCDEEAVRMIKSMPHWKPASHRGNIVRSYAMLAVTFGPVEK